MTRTLGIITTLGLVLALVACNGPEADPFGQPDLTNGGFALTNTTNLNSESLLRGQGLKIATSIDERYLRENTIYEIEVQNDDRQSNLIDTDVPVELRTDENAEISPYAAMFDVGQYGDVADGEHIRVTLTDAEAGESFTQIIDLAALRLPGWNAEEVEAPEVIVCDANGNPSNAFAVGGQSTGETVGPVYVRGSGFVSDDVVDIYIVAAGDEWTGATIPASAAQGLVLGPITVTTGADGNLPLTALDFGETDSNDYSVLNSLVGIYDLLIDTDQNGVMDFDFAVKDGGDGIGEQVGFTIQISQQWMENFYSDHILVNIAYNSSSRGGGSWANSFRGSDHIYTYMNPPVMHQYHFAVTKWIVRHQDFYDFWANPANVNDQGCVPFEAHAMTGMGIPTQRGCTNTGPTDFGPMAMVGGGSYDVVFDRNGDGCYRPGEDILDVIGGGVTGGGLVSFDEFESLEEADQVGFRVIE